jgi:cyclase
MGATVALAVFLLLALHAVPAVTDSVKTSRAQITDVAEGVYAIRHPDAPDTFPQGNTTVIVGDREVLVVDSCYLPSSAREDIARIREWTKKPVRYLVNTHWHYDHTLGNSTYLDSFPGLSIVAQTQTRKQIEGYNPGWLERYPGRRELFRQRLAKGTNDDGKRLSDGEKEELRQAIAGSSAVATEFGRLSGRVRDLTPTLVFDRELEVDLGNRLVQVRFLGRGNTAGDAVIFIPKEKILVAGDLIDHPVPYLSGGYPTELAATLEQVERLDPQVIVPGHGDVLRGKAYLLQIIDLVRQVTAQVDAQVHRVGGGSRKLDQVKPAVLKAIDVAAWRRQFAGDDKDNEEFFDDFSLPGLIDAAYAETWPR